MCGVLHRLPTRTYDSSSMLAKNGNSAKAIYGFLLTAAHSIGSVTKKKAKVPYTLDGITPNVVTVAVTAIAMVMRRKRK